MCAIKQSDFLDVYGLERFLKVTKTIKKSQNIYIKAQLESPKHLHQTPFETSKYLQQTML
jgi:hypothetical protein